MNDATNAPTKVMRKVAVWDMWICRLMGFGMPGNVSSSGGVMVKLNECDTDKAVKLGWKTSVTSCLCKSISPKMISRCGMCSISLVVILQFGSMWYNPGLTECLSVRVLFFVSLQLDVTVV